jgi:hypothetical protein
MPTHALLLGSPVIDAGLIRRIIDRRLRDLLPTDQRGLGFGLRFGPSPDIGAFEAQPIFIDAPAPPPQPPAPAPSPVVEIQATRVKRRTRVDMVVDGAPHAALLPLRGVHRPRPGAEGGRQR